VIEFLQPISMEKYSTIFISAGFSDLETILTEIDRDCLQEMHVSLGH